MGIIADGLTFSRAIIILIILGISITQGAGSLGIVLWLTYLCWLTDVLDGIFARKSPVPTRLGNYDVIADCALAITLAVLEVKWGFLPVFPVLITFLITCISTWLFNSPVPRKLAMGMVYGALIISARQKNPSWIWLILCGLAVLILLEPERAQKQVSEFVYEATALFKKRDSESTKNNR